jgi:glyoxylase-like metal-dependent hydrolase (beta-lactamase superfamily II)
MNNTTDTSTTLTYEVFVNEAPRQDNGLLPNGEPKLFSPLASTLIYGARDAVLTDPGMTVDQARILGDWTLAEGRNVTDIFITHGHGYHWFAAGVLAKRLGARVVATEGTIEQMQANIAARPYIWDQVYPGIPPTTETAETVPDGRLTLERHDLQIIDVGHTDTDETSILHVPEGVSEDLCRHERKRRSCLQPKRSSSSQRVILIRMAPAASRQASRRVCWVRVLRSEV